MSRRLMLAPEVVLSPVADLSDEFRRQVGGKPGDYVLTRTRSRSHSRLIGAQGARLLQEFRQPSSIVDAVLRYSRVAGVDAEEILESAYVFLEWARRTRHLLPNGTQGEGRARPVLQPGERVAGFEVLRCIRNVEDTQLYHVRDAQGREAALKILPKPTGERLLPSARREAAILRHLGGSVSPRLMKTGSLGGQLFLAIEWRTGVDAMTAARSAHSDRLQLLDLGCRILDAYAGLHALGVIHGDIQPLNILVGPEGEVTILDFGFSHWPGSSRARAPERAGQAYYLEPERERTPTAASEQYALAALLYHLFTGSHYLDFQFQRHEMLRQIAEDPPIPFSRRSVEPWPGVEAVLLRALSKRPSERFSDVAEFACALRRAAVPAKSGPPCLNRAGKLLEEVIRRFDPQDRLFREGPPHPPTGSVFHGAAGVAYALYRVACIQGNPQLLAWADAWAQRTSRELDNSHAFCRARSPVSPYHSRSGVHWVQALIAQAMGNPNSRSAAVAAFLAAAKTPFANPDLTLGTSGVLLATARMVEAIPGERRLREFGSSLLARSARRIGRGPRYAGIAHGWAGVIYAWLSWHRAAGDPLPASAHEALSVLAERPCSRMAGWCHGSAGFVHLWTLAHSLLREARYVHLAETAAWHVWKNGAGYGTLCCGLAGQSYALLNFYKHTGAAEWLTRAQDLAERAAARVSSCERFTSLYQGAVGAAVLAADLVRPEAACMPLFEPEGWS